VPPRAPVLSIASPADGSTFLEGQSIPFVAVASDPEDGDLTTSIVWLSNNQEIGRGNSIQRTLPPGAHTISAGVLDSSGLSAAQSLLITIRPNTPPIVTIINPAQSGLAFLPTDLVRLEATALDEEDGNLTGDLQWSSDLQGEIGRGGGLNIPAAQLAPGNHLITAAVSDSLGLFGQAQIALEVLSLPDLVTTLTLQAPPTLFCPTGFLLQLPCTFTASVQLTVQNAGGLEAGPFQVSIESDQPNLPYQVDLDGEGNATITTSEPLAAGESVTFNGRAVFPESASGQTINLIAIADSCRAGDPCLVQESDETNNGSAPLTIQLPGFPPRITILSPDGDTLDARNPTAPGSDLYTVSIGLVANASDREDGELDDFSLSWSILNTETGLEELWAGNSIPVFLAAPECETVVYQITATATDSDGQSAEDSVTVSVEGSCIIID
jgi:hypothetical protein